MTCHSAILSANRSARSTHQAKLTLLSLDENVAVQMTWSSSVAGLPMTMPGGCSVYRKPEKNTSLPWQAGTVVCGTHSHGVGPSSSEYKRGLGVRVQVRDWDQSSNGQVNVACTRVWN